MAADGLVDLEVDSVRVTTLGQAFLRNICMAFDPYRQEKSDTGPRFSRAICRSHLADRLLALRTHPDRVIPALRRYFSAGKSGMKCKVQSA
jgi:hypothetical protein